MAALALFGASAPGAQDYWFDFADGAESASAESASAESASAESASAGNGATESGESAGAGNGGPGGKIGLRAGGEIAAELLIVPRELRDKGGAVDWGNLVSAKLNFGASSSRAEAVLNFQLSPAAIAASGSPFWTPPVIDEAYLRVFLGPLALEAGLRKLAWGRADIRGPLDVTNPLDYTDLTNAADAMGRKIARPVIRASLPLGAASGLEGVFIPSFQGHRYALDPDHRWYPSAITGGRRDRMIGDLAAGIVERLPVPLISPDQLAAMIQSNPNAPTIGPDDIPDTRGLEYAQGGIRFSTTLGRADIGAQYYSGHLFRPSFTIGGAEELLATIPAIPILQLENALQSANLKPRLAYNRYHQIGLDYTRVIFDSGFRAELAAFITEDLGGDDGGVYNPFLAWSAGFDRDILGFTVFVEADGNIRLLDGRVGSSAALDTEAGSPLTATALTAQVSRAFFQDRLEAKFGLLWNIEAADIYLMPSLSYSIDDVTTVLSGGIFAGKDGGELSQYRDKAYIKTALTYSF
jgi:hypothetical protein